MQIRFRPVFFSTRLNVDSEIPHRLANSFRVTRTRSVTSEDSDKCVGLPLFFDSQDMRGARCQREPRGSIKRRRVHSDLDKP